MDEPDGVTPGYVPMAAYTPADAPVEVREQILSRYDPRTGFLIALTGLLPVVVLGAVIFGGGVATWPLIVLPSVVSSAISVGIAIVDRRALLASGVWRPPTVILALIPVVYLLLRGSRRFDLLQRQSAFAPLYVHLAILALGVVLVSESDDIHLLTQLGNGVLPF